jgi:hypothetical protein
VRIFCGRFGDAATQPYQIEGSCPFSVRIIGLDLSGAVNAT